MAVDGSTSRVPALPALRWPLAAAALLASGSLLMVLAARRLPSAEPRRQRRLRLLVALAMACAAGAFGFELAGHGQAVSRC